MSETRTVHDPFIGVDVEVSCKLIDRLRGKYAVGPHLPNGNPEFGWRQFQAPPIQHEAADKIEALEAEITRFRTELETARKYATRLCECLHEQHYWDNAGWNVLPDLLGVLTQIDNMSTGLSRASRSDL